MVPEIRGALKDALEAAYDTLIVGINDKRSSFDDALEEAADIMEEFIGEVLGQQFTAMILMMSNDLRKAEQIILTEVEELKKRRERREKKQDEAGAVRLSQKRSENRGKHG